MLPLLLLFPGSIWAQNVPDQTITSAPAGTVRVFAEPPSPDYGSMVNYIRTTAPMVPFTNESQLGTAIPGELSISTVAKDGFQRTLQTVQENYVVVNGQGRNLVTISDNRVQQESFSYLPYAVNSGGAVIRTAPFKEQKAYYNSQYPGEGYTSFSRSRLVSNPGFRETESYAPGKSQVGQDRATVTTRSTNKAGEVKAWGLDVHDLPICTGTYPARELFVEQVKASTGAALYTSPHSITYTDKDGRVVLKQVTDSSYNYTSGQNQVIGNTYLSTYYVYDRMGRLRYTLPPKAVQQIEASSSSSVNPTVLHNLCFQYRYDGKGRLAAQQFPGENGFTSLVYDRKQRVIMRQTPNEQASQQYEVTFYDQLDRVIATSLFTNPELFQTWQELFDIYNGPGFTSSDIRYYLGLHEGFKYGVSRAVQYPEADVIWGNTMMSYTYYDGYEHVDKDGLIYGAYNSQLHFTELLNSAGAETPIRSLRTQGLIIGTKVRLLPSPSANQIEIGKWSLAHNYYDDKGRVINSLKLDVNDQGNGIRNTYSGTQYDFLDRPLISKSIFQNLNVSADIITELNKNEFETLTGRLSKTSRKINNDPWNTTGIYNYDDLGRVSRKVLGNYGEVQDFAYNIRGQLQGINSNYALSGNIDGQNRSFGEVLAYDYGFSMPRYDGKISGMVWKGTANTQAYGYSYDLAGRLKEAEYRNRLTTWSKATIDYTVSNINYDKNGNLQSINQRGMKPGTGPINMDQLTFTLEAGGLSNRLERVTDNIPNNNLGDFVNPNSKNIDYDYDGNGNLTVDNNKEINNITYSHFDKPVKVTFGNGKSIEYSYDAGGNKIQELILKPAQVVKVTDYVDGYVYENKVLQFANTPEGRAVYNKDNNSFKEEYFVKDHLGNLRSTIDVVNKPLKKYLTTYELASANLEGLFFDKVAEIREDKPGSTDPADTKLGRLNGVDADRRIGTSLLMHVMAGDEVELNVNSFYEGYNQQDDNPVNGEDMMSSIIGTLTGGVGGFVGSEGHNTEIVQQLFTPTNYLSIYRPVIDAATDASRPKAYLNYVLFDENMQIDKSFSSAFQVDGNGSWQEIGTTAPIKMPINGYLAIYLSNESRVTKCYECGNVYFDQLLIKLQKRNLLEEAHYYPFGLPMVAQSSGAENNTKANRIKYQGNEYNKELGLNWMNFNARQYDPQLGRFLGADPLADEGIQDIFSPYAAMGNAPESTIDPNGTYGEYFSQGYTLAFNAPAGGEASNWRSYIGPGEKVKLGPDLPPMGSKNKGGSEQGEEYTGQQAVAVLQAIVGLYNSGKSTEQVREIITNFRFHFVFESETKEIYGHTVKALKDHPEWSVLSYNGSQVQKKKNRKDALEKVKKIDISSDRSWDEFPYAMSEQGGEASYVFAAKKSEQAIQAGQLGALVTRGKKMKKGDKFLVVPIAENRNMEPAASPSYRPKPSAPPTFIIPVIFEKIIIPRLVTPIIAPIIFQNPGDNPYEGLKG